jgi:hypothetical protein
MIARLILLLIGITAPITLLSQTWQPYGSGFAYNGTGALTSAPAIYCANNAITDVRGAYQTITYNQTTPEPISVTGWSKCQSVSGSPDSNYSLYVDTTYSDGSNLWGTSTPFQVGTHGWQFGSLIVVPAKPIAYINVYLLMRYHTGSAWFSNVTISELAPGQVFDSQAIKPPTVPGWYVRDVAANSSLVAASNLASLNLKGIVSFSGDVQSLTVKDLTGKTRAISIYYCAGFNGTGGVWWDTLRRSTPIQMTEANDLVDVSAGATNMMTTNPIAAVTTPFAGLMVGIPPSQGPVISRLFYNPYSKMLCAAFDVALIPQNVANPSTTTVSATTAACSPQWGLRDAALTYYHRFPTAFVRRASKDGIWIPFTDPETVENSQDFGFGFHEGDDSSAADAKLGIYSFRYTEPESWWMTMPTTLARTYANALSTYQGYLAGSDAGQQQYAQALTNSGTQNTSGQYNCEFQNQPWTNGAVWVLNPNPLMPHPDGTFNKSMLVYTIADANVRYGTGSTLSGEYLDSLEGWWYMQDVNPQSLEQSSMSPTFANFDFHAFLPEWFNTYEITKFMSQDLRSRGRLLMANYTPNQFSVFLPLLDVAGIEVNWGPNGVYTPDSDDQFCLRRMLCYHKPYLLLQDTDLTTFTAAMMARYFQRCLFYAVFPSMFSADASTNPYFQNPELYNRDRVLFKSTIPLIQTLSRAGWEPVTMGWSNTSGVWIERYGSQYWAVFDNNSAAKNASIDLDAVTVGNRNLSDAQTGQVLTGPVSGGKIHLTLLIGSEKCRIIKAS